jgi:hypothetical protein
MRKSEETHDLTNLDKEVLIESRNPTGPLQLVNAAAAAGGGRAPEHGPGNRFHFKLTAGRPNLQPKAGRLEAAVAPGTSETRTNHELE